MCSTPFGITDGITAKPHRAAPAAVGAQRLSASLTESRGFKEFADDMLKCSTPFGITDGITPDSNRAVKTSPRAQRLSASLTESPGHPSHTQAQPGRAQRLSASLTESRVQWWANITATRCSTPFGITDGITGWASRPGSWRRSAQRLSASLTESLSGRVARIAGVHVLNAFRHH